MTSFFISIVCFLALVDYSHGLNCWYCLPCTGTNARLVTCAGKNVCSILKAVDITGEEVIARRCESLADRVAGTCYSNTDGPSIQVCLCNTDGCNFNYTTFNRTTTQQVDTTTSATTAGDRLVTPSHPSDGLLTTPAGVTSPPGQSPLAIPVQPASMPFEKLMEATMMAAVPNVTGALTTWLNQLTNYGETVDVPSTIKNPSMTTVFPGITTTSTRNSSLNSATTVNDLRRRCPMMMMMVVSSALWCF